jgi:hypothetical protein
MDSFKLTKILEELKRREVLSKKFMCKSEYYKGKTDGLNEAIRLIEG